MLSDQDRVAIEALTLDLSAEPSFEMMKGCLVWHDEIPDRISRKGYEFVSDLIGMRGLMHLGVELTTDRRVRACKRAWDYALSIGLIWTGFSRIDLNPKDRAFLEECLSAGGDELL